MTSVAIAPSLADLEAVIDRGLATFVEVGDALLAIRDGRLYRDSHGTFEAYVAERFPTMTYRGARRLMDAADVVARLDVPTGTLLESHARELVPLRNEPALLGEVWSSVQASAKRDGTPVTAALVRTAVREHMRSEAALSEVEIQAATAHWTPAQKAAVSPDKLRPEGELMRLTGDIAALPDPVAFVNAHRDMPLRVLTNAEGAHAWLTDFLSEWRHRDA